MAQSSGRGRALLPANLSGVAGLLTEARRGALHLGGIQAATDRVSDAIYSFAGLPIGQMYVALGCACLPMA